MNLLPLILGIIIGLLVAEAFRHIYGFHSFFSRQKKSWIGFDLDGTIAVHEDRFDPRVIGEPVPAMISLMKKYLADGEEIRIVTARVSKTGSPYGIYEAMLSRYYIRRWCQRTLGQKIPVVCNKDFKMKLLYDDRARQVKTDIGEIVS